MKTLQITALRFKVHKKLSNFKVLILTSIFCTYFRLKKKIKRFFIITIRKTTVKVVK